MATPIKRDLYAEVTSRILAELELGAAPWVKPWSATPGQNVPCNAVSNRPYSGLQRTLFPDAQCAVEPKRLRLVRLTNWITAAARLRLSIHSLPWESATQMASKTSKKTILPVTMAVPP